VRLNHPTGGDPEDTASSLSQTRAAGRVHSRRGRGSRAGLSQPPDPADHYGTGGITDITARIVALRPADNLGQQVVVENRPDGGQIAFVFATIPTAHPYITSGRLTALGVTSLKRNAALPDVPTVSEAGLPGFNVNAWLGILVPAGTPNWGLT
jgi:Tripartite tricarboxylate transporter family receptor